MESESNFQPTAEKETRLRVIEYGQLEMASLRGPLSEGDEKRKQEIEAMLGATKEEMLKMLETVLLS